MRCFLRYLKNIANHYTNNGSTINLCTLDISKAFDRVSLYDLVTKLIERKVPKTVISIIMIWYEKNSIVIKWNTASSNAVTLSHGVRQGGVISPILFALYVDDMLFELNSAGIGCVFKGLPIAALMYADDIMLSRYGIRY